MQSMQRVAVRSSGNLRLQAQRQSRRHASDSHGSGHGSHHAGPSNESFGPSFYVCIAAIPISYGLYKVSRPGPDGAPDITKRIAKTYNEWKSEWAERYNTHTSAMEQAAADRLLFTTEAGQTVRQVNHRFPELANTGSPWNVPAGQGSANMDALIAKYEQENKLANEKKMKQLKEGKVPAEQPYENFRKITPGGATV